MRLSTASLALLLIASFAGAAFAQTPPGDIVVSASVGTGNTGGPTTGLYQVDPRTGAIQPINGTSADTAGLIAGVPTNSNGANAVVIDDLTGHLIVGTIASATGGAYSIREITLDPTGLNALSDTAIVNRTSPGTTAGCQAVAILPNGDILSIESVLGAPTGTIGLFQYGRLSGSITPWTMNGAPSGLAANALFFDRALFNGAGGAIVGFIGAGATSNSIVNVPFGGGTVVPVATYDNSTLVTGGGGIPSGLCLDGTGNLIVSHNNVVTGTTLVNRMTGAVIPLAPNAFGSGQNAVAWDPIRDDALPVANATGSVPTNARQVRRINLGAGDAHVIGQLAGGNSNGIDYATGLRVYGQACNSAGGANLLRVGGIGPANLGNALFGLRCTGGGPLGLGLMGIGTVPLAVNLGPQGYPTCTLYNSLDILLLPISFDISGAFYFPISLPVGPYAGLSVYFQFADGSAVPVLGLSAGLKVTLLPAGPSSCVNPWPTTSQSLPIVWTNGPFTFTWTVPSTSNLSGPFTLMQGATTIHGGVMSITGNDPNFSVGFTVVLTQGTQTLTINGSSTIIDPPVGKLAHIQGTFQGLMFSYNYDTQSRLISNVNNQPGLAAAAAPFNLAPYNLYAIEAFQGIPPSNANMFQTQLNACGVAAAPACGFWACAAACAGCGGLSGWCLSAIIDGAGATCCNPAIIGTGVKWLSCLGI